MYREQSDFAGGSKKKTNGKQESILTSNINLHEIIIDVYCIHIITYLQYVDLIQLYIYICKYECFINFASVVNSSTNIDKNSKLPLVKKLLHKLGCLDQ